MNADRNEGGVSTIIGAILIAGLLVTALVTVQVSFVPVWEKADESARLNGVEAQLAALRSDLDRQVENRTASALTHSLTLGEQRTGFFSGPPLPDRITLTSAGSSVTTHADKMKITISNGVNVGGLNPNWEEVSQDPTIEDIIAVESLRLRIEDVGSSQQPNEDMNITIFNANGDLVGQLAVLASTDPSGYIITVNITDENGDVITESVQSHFNQEFYENYYIDAMNPIYLFDQLLATAAAPFTIEVKQDPGFVTDYNIAYVGAGPGGSPIIIGGGGVERSPYNAAYIGGSLKYDTGTNRYPQQTYYLENGALILEQADGAVFKVPPTFQASRANDVVSVLFSIPVMTGVDSARSGTTNAVVVTEASAHNDVLGSTPAFDMTMNTAFPELWGALWNETLEDAGLDDTQWDVAMTGSSATLTVTGVNTDPNAYDISFILKQAQITVTIEV